MIAAILDAATVLKDPQLVDQVKEVLERRGAGQLFLDDLLDALESRPLVKQQVKAFGLDHALNYWY